VLWLSGIALFAVAVGLIAAFGPARGAARESLRGALAGREQTSRAGTLRWLAGGLLTAGAGAAGAVVAAGSAGSVVAVAVGTVAVLLGVTAFAPVAVAVVGWCASRLPLAARLAVRHAARHRLRTAAAVAAVCTAIAGSMALMFYGAADGAGQGPGGQPNARTGQVLLSAEGAARLTPEQLHAVESVLPARATLPITAVTPEAGTRPSMRPGDGAVLFPSQLVAVGGAELVRAVTGAEPAPDVTAALRAGKAVAFYPELIFDGHLRIGPDVRIPAVLALAPDYYTDLPGAVLPAGTAARHHLATHRGGVVVETTRPPTAGELAAANARALAAQLEAAPATLPAELTVGAVPAERGRDYGPMFVVLAVVSGLVTLAASPVAVGLATSEMRDDLSTLAATGAGPGLRRRIAGVQAGLIVGIGVLLGVVAGIAPAAGMVAFRGDLQWRVPWLPLAVTVLVAPLLAIAGTALLTRPRLVLVRRIE
jgi:putative ABC transport system permease protein